MKRSPELQNYGCPASVYYLADVEMNMADKLRKTRVFRPGQQRCISHVFSPPEDGGSDRESNAWAAL